MNVPDAVQDERYAYLTTQGRVTGRRHVAELWFVETDGGVYLMSGSGGLTQWCLNLQAEEQGVLRIGSRSWLVRVTFLGDDDPDRIEALTRFHERYDPPERSRLEAWVRSATVVQLVFIREVTP